MFKKIFFISIILIVVFILKYIDPNSFPLSINSRSKNWVYLIDWIYLVLFITFLYFFFTFKKWKEKTRKENISAIIAYCCLNVFIAYNFAGGFNQRGNEKNRYKKCWNNIWVIEGAILEYNSNSSVRMTTEIDFEKLIEGKYLKSIPEGSEEICCYKVFHDLSDDGFIYCVKHKYPWIEKLIIGSVSYTNLDLMKELKDTPSLFTDEEKEFILESNKELENRKKELGIIETKLTNNKFIVLGLSLPLMFLFFPSIALRN